MASLANDPGGRRRILFADTDGNRKAIRLGKMSKRQAEAVKLRIEDLAASKLSGGTPSDETARWLAAIDSILHDKLSAVGLVEPRERIVCPTLREFTEGVRDAKANLKPNTLRNYDQTIRRMVGYFGEDCKIDSIGCGDADQWPEKMLKDGLAPATVGREVKRARQFFRVAVRRKLIAENPFAEVPAPAQVNTSRGHFVTREVLEKVLAACPDNEWRLIIALSRFGGLRCPSEHQALHAGAILIGRMAVSTCRVRRPNTCLTGLIARSRYLPNCDRCLRKLSTKQSRAACTLSIAIEAATKTCERNSNEYFDALAYRPGNDCSTT